MATCADYELAANERFYDGLAVAVVREGTSVGAPYLWTYVAEALLKSAFFRVNGHGNAADVWTKQHKATLQTAMKAGGVGQTQASFHELIGLANALVQSRASIGRPMPAVVVCQLTSVVGALASHGPGPDLRYEHRRVLHTDTETTFNAADWMLSNYHLLV